MATARQIIALLSSLNEGNKEQVYAIALQVAAAEAKRGRRSVADELRTLVEQGRENKYPDRTRSSSSVIVPITKPRGELQNLLTSSYPKSRLSDLVLDNHAAGRLKEIVDQQRHREELRHHGLVPTSTVLLIGPPGSGKTLTASALAGELHLPLFGVRFDTVITRFMGETASKLRIIFDHIASTRAVYLFDEFDAIGGKRTSDNDVAEMRRVLNSFLQFLEEPHVTDSVIVCATNHPELLDRALFRRFDEVVEYRMPDPVLAKALICSRLSAFGSDAMVWGGISDVVAGLSHADLVAATEDAMKQAILDGKKRVDTLMLRDKLEKRARMRNIISKLGEERSTP